jgi:hypothetical protein
MTEYELIYKLIEKSMEDLPPVSRKAIDQFLTALLKRLDSNKFVSKSVQ